ncbi:hypothetical protein WS72_01495 [Burkholderia savannae]|uniref:Uncharacterized protein n=1 Tax=Burkholderia savannae TaxID=1637837 RepID=A0ABR5T9U8_9BURK|nr:hypothetical protein WS72_01495 [Burkholderia savannae]
MKPLKRACVKAECCLQSRLFRAKPNAAREGKREVPMPRWYGRSGSRPVARKGDQGGARRGSKKVVDALRISDHNLISLLQTTQRC